MKKILFFYAFIFIFSISHYSICSEKYKLFGITRAQYKKALVFTPLHKEPPSYFDFRMSLEALGIKPTLEKNGNIDNLIDYFSGKGEYSYSVIYILAHTSRYGMNLELFDTEAERDVRLNKLNNDPRFINKYYFTPGIAEGKKGISVTRQFITDYFNQKDSLVILMGCRAAIWADAFNRLDDKKTNLNAGAVATIMKPSAIYGEPEENLNDIIIKNNIPDLMDALSGRRGGENGDINYSIGEISVAGEEILKDLVVSLRAGDNGNYVLYQQPRIDSIEIKARKQGSQDIFNKFIYNYSYTGKGKFNPQEEYPGSKSLDIARKGYFNKNDELHVTIDFSKNILFNKEPTLLGEENEPDNSFKLCIYNAKTQNIDLEKCIDIEKDSLISYAYDLDNNQTPTGNLSDFSNKVTIRFNTTDFDNKDISLDSATIFCLAIKTADSYLLDGMHYLDTDGDGREDGAISESVDSYNNSNQTYIPYSMDGLDTNHWFSLVPEMRVENMEIDWLHVNPENKPFPA